MRAPMDLDVDLLRAFVTVVETRSFTRAAALLNRTQPAISLQIRRLETQLGSPLIDRTGRSVALTTEGAALLPQARRLLRLNDEIVATLGEGIWRARSVSARPKTSPPCTCRESWAPSRAAIPGSACR